MDNPVLTMVEENCDQEEEMIQHFTSKIIVEELSENKIVNLNDIEMEKSEESKFNLSHDDDDDDDDEENADQNKSLDVNAYSKTNSNSPYKCNDCGKDFRIMRYLEKHRRIHTGEKPYQCNYCGRSFNDWPNMNRHKRIHTGERPYRCNICEKTFSQPAVYNEHVKRHTGERPFVCTICSKGFPRAARLTVHMRVHTGERPFQCTICHRRFSQPHHLSAHIRIHTGDRPYVCDKCEMSFACISNLRRHSKQLHKTSPVKQLNPSNQHTTNQTAFINSDQKIILVANSDVMSSSNRSTKKKMQDKMLTNQLSQATAILRLADGSEHAIDSSGNIIFDSSLNADELSAKILQTIDSRSMPDTASTIQQHFQNQIPILNQNGTITFIPANNMQYTTPASQQFLTQNGRLLTVTNPNNQNNSLLSINPTSLISNGSANELIESGHGKNKPSNDQQPTTSTSLQVKREYEHQTDINSPSIVTRESQEMPLTVQQLNDLTNQFQPHQTLFTILPNGTAVADMNSSPSIIIDPSGSAHETIYLTDQGNGEGIQGNQLLTSTLVNQIQLQQLAAVAAQQLTFINQPVTTNSNQNNINHQSQQQQQQQVAYLQNGQIVITSVPTNVASSTDDASGQQQIHQNQLMNNGFATNHQGNTIIIQNASGNLNGIQQLLQSGHIINQNGTLISLFNPNQGQTTNVAENSEINEQEQSLFTAFSNTTNTVVNG